jgi:hypothetical protein
MEKQQGSLEIETAEGGGELQITVNGKQLGLALIMQALKAKLKVYGIKNLEDRDLTLTLIIPPAPEKDPVEERKRKKRNAELYPDTPPQSPVSLDGKK